MSVQSAFLLGTLGSPCPNPGLPGHNGVPPALTEEQPRAAHMSCCPSAPPPHLLLPPSTCAPLPSLLLPLLSAAHLLLQEGFSKRPWAGFRDSGNPPNVVGFSLERGPKLLSSYQKEPYPRKVGNMALEESLAASCPQSQPRPCTPVPTRWPGTHLVLIKCWLT